MPGLLGKKIGMTSVFSADGKNVPCTVIEVGPCVVTQIKSVEKDGYAAVQLGFQEAKEKNTTKPMMKLEVVTPEENMGDVIGDLNKRRGQVEGMESSRSGARIVKAIVPLAEMFGYVTALRTITSGRATSSMTYDHHAPVSSSIAKAVLEEIKGRVDLV